jgi:hypothetical protein
MADPNAIERDLREYLECESNLRRDDRIIYLMGIVNKHLEVDKLDYMINYYDFSSIIDGAKAAYPSKTMPIRISNRTAEGVEANYVLMIESFIGYLNKNKLLRRLVKFNYTR